jgi:hypothetical protein
MALSFKGSYAGAPVSSSVLNLKCLPFYILAGSRTAAFPSERTERCEHLLAPEASGGSDTAGHKEPTYLDDRKRPERRHYDNYDYDYERNNHDEDRNADSGQRRLM